MISPKLNLLLEGLQKLLRRGAFVHAVRLLERTRPVDVAVVARFLDERFLDKLLDLLPNDEVRAELLTELDAHLLDAVLEGRPASALAPLFELMSADDRADVLAALPEERRTAIIEALQPAEAEEAENFLHYDPETAGGIMSPDFFSLDHRITGAEAIATLQRLSEDVEMAYYVYVINEHHQLLGVVSLRALVTHPPQTPLSQMMDPDIITVRVTTDQEEVARTAARYNLLAVPVVDDGNRLVGIVTIDDVIDVLREEATEDILKMAGAPDTALETHTVTRNVRTRAPWLFATWLGGLTASNVIGGFSEQLEAQVALAAFLPIVLGMGGNVGSQTAVIIVRGLATGRVSSAVGWRYLARETFTGIALGVIYGVLLSAYAAVRFSDADSGRILALSLTVGLSITAAMSIAATVGAIVPLLFERMRIDPAVATGPLVTTSVDVLGTLVYFIVASFFISVT